MKNGTHTTRAGVLVTGKMLEHWEDMGMSEAEIGERLGISRMGVYKIRKKLGVPVRFRSDKGRARKPEDEKREARNAYMRGYYRRKKEK